MTTKFRSIWRAAGFVWASAALFVSLSASPGCHDFSGDSALSSSSQGGRAGGSGDGSAGAGGGTAHGGQIGSGGASGAAGSSGGKASDDDGGIGDSGAAGSGGMAGAAAAAGSGGMAGAAAAGEGGEAGDDGTDPVPPEPADYGAVRLLINGEPVCGGTLHTNSWVLTADRCIPAETEAAAVTVGFGRDSLNFQQVRSGIEILRFPGNDGTVEGRVRDLLLLGVDAPFEIDGSTTRHHIPIYPYPYLSQLICAGWDLTPDPESPTHLQRLVEPTPSHIEDRNGINLGWFVNDDLFDPLHGDLPTTVDTGIGCFVTVGTTRFQVTVHSENPELTHDGRPNLAEEAYASVLGDGPVFQWLGRALFEELPVSEFGLYGTAGICSFEPGSIELFALDEAGLMGWRRRVASEWVEREPLDPPPSTALAVTRPGVLCTPDGVIELIVTAVDAGGLWRRTWKESEQEWTADWELLPNSLYVFGSGVNLAGAAAGSFHVIAEDWDYVYHIGYDHGWGAWEQLPLGFTLTPAAIMPFEGRIELFGRDWNNVLTFLEFSNGTWAEPLPASAEGVYNPAYTSWSPRRRDLFVRSYDRLWWAWTDTIDSPWIDIGIELPRHEISAISREPGNLDVFMSAPIELLTHIIWPRPPRAP